MKILPGEGQKHTHTEYFTQSFDLFVFIQLHFFFNMRMIFSHYFHYFSSLFVQLDAWYRIIMRMISVSPIVLIGSVLSESHQLTCSCIWAQDGICNICNSFVLMSMACWILFHQTLDAFNSSCMVKNQFCLLNPFTYSCRRETHASLFLYVYSRPQHLMDRNLLVLFQCIVNGGMHIVTVRM